MSSYRCQGCRTYRPRPEYARIGLGSVCGPACAKLAMNKTRTHPARYPQPAQPSDDIPRPVRSQVAARDHSRCRGCGTNRDLHLHHIQYRSQGGDHVPHNLVTLCFHCHTLVHTNSHRYQPLLRGLLWLDYVEGRHLKLGHVTHLLENQPVPHKPPAVNVPWPR